MKTSVRENSTISLRFNPENVVDTAQLPKLNSKDFFLSSRSVYVPGEDNISLAKVPNWYRYIDVRMKAASFQILEILFTKCQEYPQFIFDLNCQYNAKHGNLYFPFWSWS